MRLLFDAFDLFIDERLACSRPEGVWLFCDRFMLVPDASYYCMF